MDSATAGGALDLGGAVKEPDYVVFRAAPGAPPLPPQWDGRWINRSDLPPPPPPDWVPPAGHSQATSVPTGRFEVRDWDGAVAEVFEVGP